MASYEKVPREKVGGLLDALIKNKTLIKVVAPEIDYERLTIVTEARRKRGGECFQIDPPEGLAEAVQKNAIVSLLFEFSTEDRLPHRFEAAVKESETQFWLWYPDHIKRFQLRNNFRIKAPADANATILIGDTKAKMVVDNLSLGGIFCHCPNRHKELISDGLQCGTIDMVFNFEGQHQTLSVDKGIVRRVEGRTLARHFGVAFEFTHVKAEAKRRLTGIIYDLQRSYLRDRFRKKNGR